MSVRSDGYHRPPFPLSFVICSLTAVGQLMFVFPGNVRRSQAQRRRQHLDNSRRVFHGMVFLGSWFLAPPLAPRHQWACVPRHGVPGVPWFLHSSVCSTAWCSSCSLGLSVVSTQLQSCTRCSRVLTVVPACTHVSVLARLPPLTSVTVRVAK